MFINFDINKQKFLNYLKTNFKKLNSTLEQFKTHLKVIKMQEASAVKRINSLKLLWPILGQRKTSLVIFL